MEKTQKLITEMERLLSELKKSVGVKNTQRVKRGDENRSVDVKFTGLTQDVFLLYREGFFKNPKTLAQIQKKLQEEGIRRPTTTLMNPMLQLIRKKVLRRNKPEKGQYEYYQR